MSERGRRRTRDWRMRLRGVLSTPGHSAATANFLTRLLAPRALYFAVVSAAQYASTRRMPLVFLGPDDVAGDAFVGGDTELVTTQDLLTVLASKDWQAAYALDYVRARSEIEGGVCIEALLPLGEHAAEAAHLGRIGRAGLSEQAEAMAAVVRQHLSELTEGRMAVVCDAVHLYASETQLTLYSRLYEETAARHLTDGNAALTAGRV